MNKKLLKAGAICLGLAGWFSSGVSLAQSDPSGMKRVTGTFAITNATIFKAPGKQGEKSTILIKNGVIQGIGTNLTLPKEARLIVGDSLFIYPGFIAGASDAGITKPKDPEKPEDFVSSNPPDEIAGITPWRSALDQFSIGDSKVDDIRKIGFTVVQLQPDGNMIAGKTAVVALGSKNSTNILGENKALKASFNGARGMYPGTAVGVMAKFRDVYHNTKLTDERTATFASNSGINRPEITPTYRAMHEVVTGEIPVMFSASSDLEVRRAISLQKELGFKLVLTDLQDYDNVIDLIKSSGAKVLIKLEVPDDKAIKNKMKDATEEAKALQERVKAAYEMTLAQPSKLEKAGIPFAFTLVDVKSADVMKALRLFKEHGLSEQAALAALTTNAASILGISRYAGDLEKGKMANLIISTDSIFKEDAQIKHVMVDGYLFDYETKSKKKSDSKSDSSDDVKIEGSWEYTSETPAGASGGVIVISKDGSSYSGTVSYDDPSGSGKASSTLNNIELDGNQLTFSFDVNAGGDNITVDVSAEIEGESLEGSMNIGEFGSFPIKGTYTPSLIATK